MPPLLAAICYKTIGYAQRYRSCSRAALRYDRHLFGLIRTWTLYYIFRWPSHGRSFHNRSTHFLLYRQWPYRRPGRFRTAPEYAAYPNVGPIVRYWVHSCPSPNGANSLPHKARYALIDRTRCSSIPVLLASPTLLSKAAVR